MAHGVHQPDWANKSNSYRRTLSSRKFKLYVIQLFLSVTNAENENQQVTLLLYTTFSTQTDSQEY